MTTQISAKVIADSISGDDMRLTTLQLCYPRFIHAEAKTHRILSADSEQVVVHTGSAGFMDDPMLSRNASSSRAIPVAKMIEQVRNDPAMPVHWGKNVAGMQAREELTGDALDAVRSLWLAAARGAADLAERMMRLGGHKQVVNRILEPFQWMHVIVTATEWDNFFELRDHEDAEPNIQVLARCMKEARAASTPIKRYASEDGRWESSWHLPYVADAERELYRLDVLRKASVARCARVSFLNHDGTYPVIAKDVDLYDRLVGARPLHASPTEHVAMALKHKGFVKNLRGWEQHRVAVEKIHAPSVFA
jgi:thymidylate synthase ThyX